MKTSQTDILILPGMGGGGPDYWYERWGKKLSTARRVEQENWDQPILKDWCETVIEAVATAKQPVVLIGHSLGVVTAVHVANKMNAEKIVGAYLVAPPDIPNVLDELPEIAEFHPTSNDPLPFPSVLVASTDDPYCDIQRAEDLAYTWGSKFENAGASGHINAESGQGPWPEGLLSFAQFMARL